LKIGDGRGVGFDRQSSEGEGDDEKGRAHQIKTNWSRILHNVSPQSVQEGNSEMGRGR